MKAIFAYFPVVHKGTIDFLDSYPDTPIFILDNVEGMKENVFLERDIRALPARFIQTELVTHGYSTVSVVKPQDLVQTLGEVTELIIPDDEIIEFFIAKYLPSITPVKVNVFLRWTKQISTTEFVVPPDRVISKDTFAKNMMSVLFETANQSPDWWRQIAAAIVRDNEIIAEAVNTHYPTTHSLSINGDPRSNFNAGEGAGIYTSIHAEACAIAKAARYGKKVEGADVYITTFPCPTCARSLVEAGIQRVFYSKGYSVLDAESILKNAGIEIVLVQD
jgi:dCMP deaminase